MLLIIGLAGFVGTCSGFARAIFDAKGIGAELSPISRDQYRAAARRKRNSILGDAKLQRRLAEPA